jgi:hypothetical protein
VELGGTLFSKIGDISLEVNELVIVMQNLRATYQVEDALGGSLVGSLLANEQETLSGV